MIYIFQKKFSERHIDDFATKIYKFITTSNKEKLVFDLSGTERISNQNLLLLTAVWKYLAEKNITFKVKLFRDDFNEITKREAQNIVQLWEVWKVYQIIPNNKKINDYFFIRNESSITTLKNKYKIHSRNEIYNRYGITPFIELNKIDNFKDFKVLKNIIAPIYKLNRAVFEIIKKHNCEHPFLNKTISSIITKELYENFLDHFNNSFFKTTNNWAFLSLAIKSKVLNNSQSIIKRNFGEEELEETKSFFIYKNGKFKNENYIQFSFLDFGNGIVETIKNEFNINKGNGLFVDDNEVLKYAFNYDTSQHPIYDKYKNIEKLIPRGLFDILSIIKRYKGLIIIRSNRGRIAFDFSNNKNFKESYITFGKNENFFPGTFFSIYIPSHSKEASYDSTTIKPVIDNLNYSSKIPQGYLSLFSIINEISNKNYSKSILYQKSIEKLKEHLLNNNKKLFFIDFQGWEIDSRITKVLMFYLASDYDVNLSKNIVILNPPDESYLKIIKNELFDLLEETGSFQTHPLPFISFNQKSEEISIFWLGIYNDNDIEKLKKLLFIDSEIDLRKTDFEDPDNVIGNLSEFDSYGNIKTIFPDKSRIVKFYKEAKSTFENNQISELLDCTSHSSNLLGINKNNIFLCSGNYYTKNYLRLDSLLINELKTDILSNLLYNRISDEIGELSMHIFIAVTSSSYKILKSFKRQGLIKEENSIFIENYHKSLTEHELQSQFKYEGKYILVCDVIATGYLTNKINEELKDFYRSELSLIAVFVDTIDKDFSVLNEELEGKIISLQKFPIRKYLKEDIGDLTDYNIIRVNPFTNQPITLSYKSIDDNLTLISPERFIKFCDYDDLKIKYLNFNNEIHSYFFDMENILSKKGEELISIIFGEIDETHKKHIDIIFYPQKSAVEKLNLDFIKSNILKNQKILDFEIERFPTKDGWRFSHLSSFYKNITKDKKLLIIDDTACSGDSLLQLINEVSFLEIKEIVIIIILSRISDQRAEFFSKLSYINNNIPIKIYFGCHWQISTYSIYNNPILNEGLWLNRLISLKNLPSNIKNIAKNINKEIKQVNYFKSAIDYKYFPLLKSNDKIDKLGIFSTRNNIGKISGFRFYKENFKIFDKLLQNDRDFKNIKENKEIELICFVLLYEPFLFDKIQRLLPDIAKLIRDFLNNIIFLNKIDINNDLYYKWDKKDIIHLFFITYKNSLVKKFKEDNGNFLKLILFSKDSFKRTNSINYLFYKILVYFPFSKDEISIKDSFRSFKSFLNETLNNKSLDKKSFAELRRFYSFTNTLPHNEDFLSQIQFIKDLYWEHKQNTLHDKQKSFNHNITLLHNSFFELKSQVEKGEILDEETIQKLKEYWWNIKYAFLNHLISFYRTFHDFFKPYPYFILLNKIEGKKTSLIEMYTFLDDYVFNINQRGYQIENYKISIEFIEIINNDLGLGSEFNKLFENPHTSFHEFKYSLENSLNETDMILKTNKFSIKNFQLNIPEFYTKKLIYNEIKNNIENYCKKDTKINIIYSNLKNKESKIIGVKVELSNEINKDIVVEFSSKEGLNSLIQLSESDLFNFEYSYKPDNDIFIQTFKIFIP